MTTTMTRPTGQQYEPARDARAQALWPAVTRARPAAADRAWPAVRILEAEIAPPMAGAPAPGPPAPRAPPAAADRAWPAVRILEAEIAPPMAGAPAGYRRVRVVVHLGRLRPADVAVHLTTGRARCADATASDGWSVRLASSQSYGNGTFVFDGQVAEGALTGPRRPVALVEPSRGPDDAEPAEAWTVRRLVARPLEWGAGA